MKTWTPEQRPRSSTRRRTHHERQDRPDIAGSVSMGFGINELLDQRESIPNPLLRKVVARTPTGTSRGEGRTFRAFLRAGVPRCGPLRRAPTLFRVLSGTLKTDSEFYNVTTTPRSARQVFLFAARSSRGGRVGAGDLAASQSRNTPFGDTIAAPGNERFHAPDRTARLHGEAGDPPKARRT
jgi:translation elongation factor EF-G